MRLSIAPAIRAVLVAFLSAGMVSLPSMAAASKPLGMVVAADHAYLDHADAATGASVYSDDALVTEQGGSLRLSVGASQIYLLSLSSASLEPRNDKIQARIDRGTVGFSTARPSQTSDSDSSGCCARSGCESHFRASKPSESIKAENQLLQGNSGRRRCKWRAENHCGR